MINKIVHYLRAPLRWLRTLYDWTRHWARTKFAVLALFVIAFMESSFFPIPPDVLLIAMVIYTARSWFYYAFICTTGSVVGSFLGYLIGWGLYETIGKMIVATYHMEDVIRLVGQKYTENAFLTIFTAAFTPIPYKAITITAGLFKIPLAMLIFASIIGRAGRFFLVAGTLRVFGKKIEDSIEKYFDIFSIVFVLLMVIGFLMLKSFAK